tara:strand:+ start:751 stop:1071 length:321 start_codon:yes stop_codon:yes gene_type:complete
MLELTDSAIQHFLKETKEMLDPAIRVGIKGGGCGGFEYLIEYAEEIKEDDNILDFGKFMIVIDPISQPLIEGSTLDFHKEAFNQNIKIANPNVEMACGCGVSVTFK